MGMNDTPSGERLHIGFFGRRNAGKSSLVNAVTNQQLAVVSSVEGTTTDPVKKAMELLPIGPVVIIDTPGFDDEGELGALRVQKTKQILAQTDVAVLVVDASEGEKACEKQLIAIFEEKKIPYLIVYNKLDLLSADTNDGIRKTEIDAQKKEYNKKCFAKENAIFVSAKENIGIYELKERIGAIGKGEEKTNRLVGDLISQNDFVVLVVPIDKAAPKGRLILPQQQVIRDVLESGATALVVRDHELADTLANTGKKPTLVITDSQAFEEVKKIVPEEIPLTSFSILMARYKGFLTEAVRGVTALDMLKDGDTILISEGCTHHRQCGDIGSVKLPAWIKRHTGKKINIELSSGTGFPEELSKFALVIHCGGCMLNDREIENRMHLAVAAGVPFTNYGIAIAYMKGILGRSIAMLPEFEKILSITFLTNSQ